jgi:hypothetical protein
VRLAHVVAGPGAGLDATLLALAQGFAAEGRRVTGAVQKVARDGEGRILSMHLHLLPDDTAVDIAQPLGPGSGGCRLDAGALETAAAAIARRVEAGADLLVLGRFGEREMNGGGFRDVIAAALMRDVPVLVGVSAMHRAGFEAFAGPETQALAAEIDALRHWAEAAIGAR